MNQSTLMTTQNNNISDVTFDQIYDRYFSKIYNYTYFNINSHEAAEDITMHVFEKIFVNLYKYASQKSSLSTWIFTIAKNTIIDYYRDKKNKDTHLSDELADILECDNSEACDDLVRDELCKSISNLLKILSDKNREIIILKYWMDMSNTDIANSLNMPLNSVNVSLFRSLKKMKSYIEKNNLNI